MSGRIDDALNRITMYRLTLYYVAGLLMIAFGLSFFGFPPGDPTTLAFSGLVITAVCWTTNRAFAILFRVPVNAESIYITAVILTLVLPPVAAANHSGVEGMLLASFVAVASKFVLALGRKHIFNPVAIGIAASALLLDQPATWWVGGNLILLPFVLAGGLLVVRKVQRFDMVGVYVFSNLAATLATTSPSMFGEALLQSVVYSPLLFAGFAMLTEPMTEAHGKWQRIAYGTIVGTLSSPNIHVGSFYLTPEIAFLVGNAVAFVLNPKGRFKFTLLRVEQMASDCYDYVFKSDRKLAFQPGQYLDWTLDVRNSDDRGNRRPFTIASAPTDREVRLGVKFYPVSSAFKRTLASMRPGDAIYGSQPAGAFTLPKNSAEKLAFLAGGIGITPFRSMVRDLIRRQDKRSIVLLYGANKSDEIAYSYLFEMAERELGMRTVYVIAQDEVSALNCHRGFIDEALIQQQIPDFRDRIFYVSGPRAMVTRFQHVLRELGVARSRIKVDFFPGFA
jgi:glycine betaine catabolism B